MTGFVVVAGDRVWARGFYNDQQEPLGVYEGKGDAGSIGIGETQLVSDRMPLSMRARLADDSHLPPSLRLDVTAKGTTT